MILDLEIEKRYYLFNDRVYSISNSIVISGLDNIGPPEIKRH